MLIQYPIEVWVICITIIYNISVYGDDDKKINKNMETVIQNKWDSENGYIIFCLCMGK